MMFSGSGAWLLLALCGIVSSTCPCRSAYLNKAQTVRLSFWDGENPHTFQKGEYAHACFCDEIEENGWSKFRVYGNPDFYDDVVAHCAGYLEGYLTSLRLWQYSVNGAFESVGQTDYVHENWKWMQLMQSMAKSSVSNRDKTYWWQISLMNQQLMGIVDGYGNSSIAQTDASKALSLTTLIKMNFYNSIETLTSGNLGTDRCSVIIKDLKDDLFVAHNTWGGYQYMIRVYKMYDLPFQLHAGTEERVPAQRIAFPSYPGSIFSGDDFYTTTAGMVILETTFYNHNPTLYKDFLSPFTVWEGQRNMLANRLASTGEDWFNWYKKYNSGTYNNMNMIVDLKAKESNAGSGLLWVIEQLPGRMVGRDQTALLKQKGYFSSYNVPFYPEIRKLSGYDAMAAKYGDFYDYWKTARALLFKKYEGNVTSLKDLQWLMRYNNFKKDPMSVYTQICKNIGWTNCTPPYTAYYSIACRDDLNDPNGVYPLPKLGFRNEGAMDAKIMQLSKFNNSLWSKAISGPTTQQQPAFDWRTTKLKGLSHIGQPDVFNFSWVDMVWP